MTPELDRETKSLRCSTPPPPPPSLGNDYGTIPVSMNGGRGSHDATSSLQGADCGGGSVILTPRHTGHSSITSRKRSVLIKTQTTFVRDALYFSEGTIPHSMVLALAIGCVCGVAAYVYYSCLEWALEFIWKTLPEKFVLQNVPERLHVLWIPVAGLTLATCLGLTVVFMGEPGDLPYTIKCVHDKAYVAMNHVMPMVCASLFSILGGGSLGPEAPLVAICAALGGFVSRHIFRCQERNLIRKHTLMGMAGALAAFFGCPLGGSLFAMEVNSRWGIEYFEHTVEAIFCGEVCLAVFRALSRLPIRPIWDLGTKLECATPLEICYGAGLGLIGGFVAALYAHFYWKVAGLFGKMNLLDNSRAVRRAWVGAIVIITLGMLVPHTMFWGEFEFQTIASMSPASTLQHIWPTRGLLAFEMDSFGTALLVGIAKLVAISFSVAGGYRGGYIFPFFAAAAALGRAVYIVCPFIPVQLCVLCLAAAVNVAVTRTALATTIILTYLAGEPNALSAILAASLVSLFVTGYMPFIASQVSRVDLEHSTYTLSDDDEVSEMGDTVAEGTPFVRDHKSNASSTQGMV